MRLATASYTVTAAGVRAVVAGRAGEAPWGFRAMGRYFDLLHCREGRWLFHSRTLRFTDDA